MNRGIHMFPLRLKQLRVAAGYTQQSFADAFGVAQSTVGNWEAGIRQPNNGTLFKLADFFGVSYDFLIGAAKTEKDPFSERFRERAQLSISLMDSSDLAEAAANGYPLDDIDRILKQSYPLSLAEACIVAFYIGDEVSELLGENEDDYLDSALEKILQDPIRWLNHLKKRRKSKKKEMFEQKYNALTPAHKKIIDDIISAFLIQQKKSEE